MPMEELLPARREFRGFSNSRVGSVRGLQAVLRLRILAYFLDAESRLDENLASGEGGAKSRFCSSMEQRRGLSCVGASHDYLLRVQFDAMFLRFADHVLRMYSSKVGASSPICVPPCAA